MVWIEGGSFTRGATGFYPDEGPLEDIRVGSFWIDRFEVTNARFGEFVDATGYVTVAETQPDPEDFPGIDPALLEPGSVVFTMPTDRDGSLTQWWRFVPGANWQRTRRARQFYRGTGELPGGACHPPGRKGLR